MHPGIAGHFRDPDSVLVPIDRNLELHERNFALLLRMPPCEDAGHERQHVGRTAFIVTVVADQTRLHDVDLFLRRLVHQRFDTRLVNLIVSFWSSKQLQFEGLLQAFVGLVVEALCRRWPGRRCSS